VTLAVRPLSVVPEGDEFIVGDAELSVYVVLPAIGVQLLDTLRAGATLGDAAAQARRSVGEEVDVTAFAHSLLELGFATPADDLAAHEGERRSPPAPRWLRGCFSATAWLGYALCALAAVALIAIRPGLLPGVSDIFFLSTPARSLAALTAMALVLAGAHEACHWLAARAEGVRARITVSRRLYFFALEIDLTGLWSLPRRRRYSALLAGMAFDAIVLFGLLLARFGDEVGWWPLSDPVTRLCAALTFVQLFAIASQFFVFARTDVYAVLITATGCVNLFRVNQLLARRALRRLSPEQERELAEAHLRDVAIGRWFRWLYLLGLAAAAWFFVVYFAPATITLVVWIARTIAEAELGSVHFAEAVLFAGLMLSTRILTLAVALRDLCRWRRPAPSWPPARARGPSADRRPRARRQPAGASHTPRLRVPTRRSRSGS
jgi:putative peptide zinc metalloprotease protein